MPNYGSNRRRLLSMHPPPKHHANRAPDTGGVIRQSESHAAIQPKRIIELMVKAAESISPGRGIGLRNILAENFCVKTCVLVKVVAKGERLLSSVPAFTSRLTVRLNQRAIYDDIDDAVPPIVVIHQQYDLLAEALKHSI